MSYDLRFERWIPFRRRSGALVWGAPSLLTDALGDDPVVAIAAPRPDFTGALTEFLIGLMSYALAAQDEDEWLALWNAPPSPEVLQEKLSALPPAFDLDGDGPRFLQDFVRQDFEEKKNIRDIRSLLIDVIGCNDFFVKPDRYEVFGCRALAMALITLQSYAPEGGSGLLTSLRGGGPLTTLIEPRVNKGGVAANNLPLWELIWANAETVEQWQSPGRGLANGPPESVFPWLAPTRISDTKAKGGTTTPQDAHAMQVYFGMPRRIRIDFESKKNKCSLIGNEDAISSRTFRSRTYGVKYTSEAWRHPLTPYYRDNDGQVRPRHGQPGGFCWRDWDGLLFSAVKNDTFPAQCVTHFLEFRSERIKIFRPRFYVWGYDTKSAKVRCWIQSDQPALALDKEKNKAVSRLARHLADAADFAGSILLIAVKAEKFDRPADVKGDLSFVKARLWAETEAEFYRAINLAADNPDPDAVEKLQQGFLAVLSRTVEDAFDAFCPSDGIEFTDIRRHVAAHHGLSIALRGYGKLGAKLFGALELPVPEKKTKSTAKMKGAAA